MIYGAALTYHPTIGTFRGQRGAWRVVQCYPLPSSSHPRRPSVGRMVGCKAFQVLFLCTTKKLHPHTFTNPTALLRRGVLVTASSTTKE